MLHSGLAAHGQPPHVGPSHEYRAGSNCERLDDMGATTNTTVEKYLGRIVNRRNHLRQRAECRNRAVELPTTVIGDNHAVSTMVHRPSRVRSRENAIHDKLARPRFAQPSHVIPGER